MTKSLAQDNTQGRAWPGRDLFPAAPEEFSVATRFTCLTRAIIRRSFHDKEMEAFDRGFHPGPVNRLACHGSAAGTRLRHKRGERHGQRWLRGDGQGRLAFGRFDHPWIFLRTFGSRRGRLSRHCGGWQIRLCFQQLAWKIGKERPGREAGDLNGKWQVFRPNLVSGNLTIRICREGRQAEVKYWGKSAKAGPGRLASSRVF